LYKYIEEESSPRV